MNFVWTPGVYADQIPFPIPVTLGGTGATDAATALANLGAITAVSPSFTGTPTAPTAGVDTNTTQLATTAFVLGQAGSAAPLVDGTAAAGSSLRWARQDHVHPTDITRASLASPSFTGTPAAPTAVADTNTTQLATTAFVLGQAGSAAPLVDGTAAAGSSLRYARQDHVHPTDTTRAPLASPSFTGAPLAPTAAADTNTTQLATTAFVLGQAGSAAPIGDGAAAAGTSLRYARQDHVHPTDTTRAPLASPSFTGQASINAGNASTSYVLDARAGSDSKLLLCRASSAGGQGAIDFTNNGASVAFGSLLWTSGGLTFFGGTVSAFSINTSGHVGASVKLTAPTMAATTNTTDVATTAFVWALPAQQQIADGAVGGGNARGAGAVDWQSSRTSSAQVASGATATIGGGRNNLASATDTTVNGGQGNSASGAGSWVPGGVQATDNGLLGRGAWSAGQIAAQGDAQAGEYVLRQQTTSATPARITANGAAAGTTNTINLRDFAAVSGLLIVTAKAQGSTAAATWRLNVSAVRGSGAASVVVYEGGLSGILPSSFNGAGSGWRLDIAADTTNGGIGITVTGAAATTINSVARFIDVETFTAS
jgi:hypothetical protein